jgi:hypothetical protein
MKISSIKKVGRKPVYDLSVAEVEHYVLKNGVVTHNTGIYYSANQIFIITKAQEKEGNELTGFKFTINIEKSRYVKEKAKLPFTVYFDEGIQKWSSLFELAQEAGYIIKSKPGWYQVVDIETGEIQDKSYRAKDLENNDEFFEKLTKNKNFKEFIERKFKLTNVEPLEDVKKNIVNDDFEDEVDNDI